MERLVDLHDFRAVRWSTFFGNLGMLGGRGVREIAAPDDLMDPTWLRDVGDHPNALESLPAVVRVDPATVPTERLHLLIAGEEHRLAQSNYLRTILHVPGLIAAFALTDNMRERFVEANRGLTPEEVLFCTWVADFVQTTCSSTEPGVWVQFRTAGFCTYSTKALLTMWCKMAENRDVSGWFPRSVVSNVRRDREDLMKRFYSNFAFTRTMQASLSVQDGAKKYFIIELSPDFVLVDFTRLLSLLIEATEFVLEEKQAELKRTKLFETELAGFLASQAGVQRFAFPVGSKFEDDRGTFAEVDVSPVIANCLLWVECKTGKWSQAAVRGEHKAVRNRWAVVAAGDKSWLRQAERSAREVARRRTWKNGMLPEDVKWILPVVCSSRVEYIAEDEQRYFLNEEIPRICTPGELAKFIAEWNWEWIKTRPYLIGIDG
jgi:hypothetical protein